jgi:hypothetical protein
VIFDLRDNPVTTPETDRRRGRLTIAVVAVLVVVLGGLVVAFLQWTAARLDQSETRAHGDEVMDAIAWPPQWERQSAGFRPALPFVTDGRPRWSQQIATDIPDLSTADSSVHDILTAAGWQAATDCRSDQPNEVRCGWKADGYRLDSAVVLGAGAGSSCPQDRVSCAQLTITLTPERPERT